MKTIKPFRNYLALWAITLFLSSTITASACMDWKPFGPMMWAWTWLTQQMDQFRTEIQDIKQNSVLTDEQKGLRIIEILNSKYQTNVNTINSSEYLSDKWKAFHLEQMKKKHDELITAIKQDPSTWIQMLWWKKWKKQESRRNNFMWWQKFHNQQRENN